MDEFEKALDEYYIARQGNYVNRFAKRERVLSIHRAALEDAERLDFVVSHGYFFGHTRDGESCWLMRHADGDGDLRVEKLYESHPNARAAIDAALAANGEKA